MKEAIFQYKCRMCGEVYDESVTSKENAIHILVAVVHKQYFPAIAERFTGVPPLLIGIHSGCKIGTGVSDLIGYVIRGEDD